ncbi:hypothetical protein BS17DRAFT_681186, partial [Gyrodon lividus]
GYVKCLYCQFPTLSKEADFEINVLAALDSVPLITMHQFSTCSHQFIDAYSKGLTGK